MATVASFFRDWLDFFSLLFPPTCIGCGRNLGENEQDLCHSCLRQLLTERDAGHNDMLAIIRMAHKVTVADATALLLFTPDGLVQKAVHAFKYCDRQALAILLGHRMGRWLTETQRFSDVDLLLPVPLHPRRQSERGYNQSELLCRGIADTFHRPVDTKHLIRTRYTQTQTKQTFSERQKNMVGAFAVEQPDTLRGKHVLLIDDVMTTGATLACCCDALYEQVPDVRISVAVLSVVGHRQAEPPSKM